MKKYKIKLWRGNNSYCKQCNDPDFCMYELIIEAESDYMAREKAVRNGGLWHNPRELPIIYSVDVL